MHIQQIRIVNYRNFGDFTMKFQKGLNVILGANNSGKTGLFKAISLLNEPIFSIDDLNKNNLKRFGSLFRDEAPEIIIEYIIRHEISEDNTDDESILRLLPFISMNEMSELRNEDEDSKAAIYDITAKIRAVCSLDVKALASYRSEVAKLDEKAFDLYLSKLQLFERRYEWTFYNMDSDNKVDKKEATSVFDVRYIGAERTCEEVRLEAKKEIEAFAEDENVQAEIMNLKNQLSSDMKGIVSPVLERLADVFGNENNDIGLKKGNMSISQDMQSKISIGDSYITEVEDTKSDFTVPLEYNGLGYNNLINIYMLLKFTEIRKGKDFKILLLEEPEAHLHPGSQYKLFKYLCKLDKSGGLNQQIFVTTHSSNISAVAGIDNMYLLDYVRDDSCVERIAQSLKEQFEYDMPKNLSQDEQKEHKLAKVNKETAKKNLVKFLDVTRSDMLFADKVILVEGLAEKLLMPKFMERCGFAYEDEHLSIVEIGGKHFEHFIELFNQNPVTKKVLCLTDKDYKWSEFGESVSSKKSYSEYVPSHIANLQKRFPIKNLLIKTQTMGGQTFEDELFLENMSKVDIVKSLLKIVASDEAIQFIDLHELSFTNWSENYESLRSNSRIRNYINTFSTIIESDKANAMFYEKLFFAQLFLSYAAGRKGDLALSILVDDGLLSELNVPQYIEEGIKWLKT